MSVFTLGLGLAIGGAITWLYMTKPKRESFNPYLRRWLDGQMQLHRAARPVKRGIVSALTGIADDLRVEFSSQVLGSTVLFEEGPFWLIARVPVGNNEAMMFLGLMSTWICLSNGALRTELERLVARQK